MKNKDHESENEATGSEEQPRKGKGCLLSGGVMFLFGLMGASSLHSLDTHGPATGGLLTMLGNGVILVISLPLLVLGLISLIVGLFQYNSHEKDIDNSNL